MTRRSMGTLMVGISLLASLALVHPASAQDPIARYVYGDDAAAGLKFFREQDTDRWCWAATALMIMAFHGQSQWLQCIQADDANPGKSFPRSCCDDHGKESPLCNRTGWPQFEHYGFTSLRTADYKKLEFSEVVEQIDKNFPIAVAVKWRTGGGHMGAVVGYQIDDKGRPWVLLIDPDGFHSAILMRYETLFNESPGGVYTFWRGYYNITNIPQ